MSNPYPGGFVLPGYFCMDLPSSTFVFDTETTDLPQFKSPVTDPRQPHITQLAGILYDSSWRQVGCMNFLIKPAGWTINPVAAQLTGITDEMCERHGIALGHALSMFLHFVDRAEVCVAHNFAFDKLLTEIAAHRCARPPIWHENRRTCCTMLKLTNVCRLPGKFGFKWPKLQEAHKHLFGHEFESAHDALADVAATGRVFNYSLRHNLFTL
jgi:DNA polymerase III epsilon subunit-like protein